jgi:hypothetical protein
LTLTSFRINGKVENAQERLKNALLGLRDFLRSLESNSSAMFHAAADLLHFYLSTENWFHLECYNAVMSSPLEESELGLQLKEPAPQSVLQYSYHPLFIQSALLSWITPMMDRPEAQLLQSRRLLVQLPSMKNCFAANPRHRLASVYEPSHRQLLEASLIAERAESIPLSPKEKFFHFESHPVMYGSPFFDFMLTQNREKLKQIHADFVSWSPPSEDSGKSFLINNHLAHSARIINSAR